MLRESGAGTAGLVIAGHPDVGHSVASRSRSRTERADLPSGARYALDLVQATDELRPAVTQLLGGVVVAASLEQAADLTRATPGLRVVTRDGDVLGAHWAIGGSAGQQSLLEVRAAADDAATGLQEAQDQCENAAERLAVALSAESAARLAVDEARARMRQADSGAAEISGRLGRLAGAARAAGDEVRRLETAIETAQRAGEKDQARLAELTGQLTEAENSAQAADPDDADPDGADQDGAEADSSGAAAIKDTLAQRCTMARNAEMEARLEVRTVEERLRAIEGRADALNSAATAERQARERAQARLRQRAADAAVARAVARGAQLATARAEQSLEAALARRTEAEHATAEGADELKVVRARVRDLAAELDTVVSSAHGAEIARAEHRLRLEQMEAHAVEEFGVQAAELVADYGPAVPIPAPADAEEGTLPTAYDRAVQERRAAAAQRDLDKLGKVNPLALEEYAALQERHTFLATQLEDLKKTRRDLLTVVKEVDDRVQEVFASAYADTAREFEQHLLPAVPRRPGAAGADRAGRHAGHRHRGRGPAAGQEGQAAVPAVRRRALAHRHRLPVRHLQGPPVPVLRPGRGRGGAGRHQPAAPAGHLHRAAGEFPAHRGDPPAPHDGVRRRALRRQHARRRSLRRSQPAPQRTRTRLTPLRGDPQATRALSTGWGQFDRGHTGQAVPAASHPASR